MTNTIRPIGIDITTGKRVIFGVGDTIQGASTGAHTHIEGDVTSLVADLATKAPLASPAFTGTPTGITKVHVGLSNVDNTSDASKPISSLTQSALDLKAALSAIPNGSYRTISEASGSHIAGRVAGTYMMGAGDPLAATSTPGILYPLQLINLAGADYPTVGGLAPKLRIRATVAVNLIAPTSNFTVGLYPLISGTGATGLKTYSLSVLVSGSSTPTITAPAGASMTSVLGSDFALPSDGVYVLGVVTTATIATSSLVHVNAVLQMHNA